MTACLGCNSKRQDTPWRRYAPEGSVQRILKAIRRQPNINLARAIITGQVSRAEALTR